MQHKYAHASYLSSNVVNALAGAGAAAGGGSPAGDDAAAGDLSVLAPRGKHLTSEYVLTFAQRAHHQ